MSQQLSPARTPPAGNIPAMLRGHTAAPPPAISRQPTGSADTIETAPASGGRFIAKAICRIVQNYAIYSNFYEIQTKKFGPRG